jgi:phosphinothricin acetyltransferase
VVSESLVIGEKIGRKNGVWKDNKLMEYRSKIIGIEKK